MTDSVPQNMNKFPATGESNMQLIARQLQWYAKMADAQDWKEIAKEMRWLSDVAIGEHAHCVEMHRLVDVANARFSSLNRAKQTNGD